LATYWRRAASSELTDGGGLGVGADYSAGEGVEHGLGRNKDDDAVNRTKTALSLEGEFFRSLAPGRVNKGRHQQNFKQKKV